MSMSPSPPSPQVPMSLTPESRIPNPESRPLTPMSTFVGIDGGGTGSRAVVLGYRWPDPRPCRRRAGARPRSDPAAGASALADLVDRALRAAGARASGRGRCRGALAGAGRADVRRELSAADDPRGHCPARPRRDRRRGGLPRRPRRCGIFLVAGTGSIAWGRGKAGELARAGGWGERLDDEGSALPSDATRSGPSSFRAHDGRARPTALAEAILPALGLDLPDGLVAWATRVGEERGGRPRRRTSSSSPAATMPPGRSSSAPRVSWPPSSPCSTTGSDRGPSRRAWR